MPSYVPAPLEPQEFPKSELRAVLESMRLVMNSWAYLAPFDIGFPAEGPTFLNLEKSVHFTGRARGILNVRTTPELGALLAEYTQGEPGTPEAADDAFREFVNIYCGHLMTFLWGQENAAFDPYLPVDSTPAQWPSASPSAACCFLVGDAPVEVRLWVEREVF